MPEVRGQTTATTVQHSGETLQGTEGETGEDQVRGSCLGRDEEEIHRRESRQGSVQSQEVNTGDATRGLRST